MFTYQNQVFANPYVMMDQLCIAGDPIEPAKYYCEEGRVKVDFSESYVFPYKFNELLIFNGQIYMNGMLLATKEFLAKEGIKYYQLENMFPREVQDWVECKFPEATCYSGHMCSGSLNRK
jgi:hypothetical protein